MRIKSLLIILFSLILLSGCATQANRDPLEGYNRAVYKFNDVTDKAIFKPVATAYTKVAPSPIRKGISNFFSNLGTIKTILNDLLQFKFAQAFQDSSRFIINSTFGIAGLIDVASMDGIPKHDEDFGQTLGHWGVGSGPYIVMPFLGPSNLRDMTGFAFDTFTTDPATYIHNKGDIRASNQWRMAYFTSVRSELLNASDLIDQASLDPYAFMRDAYLQRREALIADQAPGDSADDDDFGEEFEEE